MSRPRCVYRCGSMTLDDMCTHPLNPTIGQVDKTTGYCDNHSTSCQMYKERDSTKPTNAVSSINAPETQKGEGEEMSNIPTPLTDSVYAAGNNQRDYTSGKAFLDMRDHARQLERENTRLRTACKEAMETIEGLAMGGIGEGGPTLEELDSYAEATGKCWEGDADYHTGQRAWMVLNQAIKELK